MRRKWRIGLFLILGVLILSIASASSDSLKVDISPDWRSSIWNYNEGMYIARLLHGQDLWSLFQFFVIQWNLEWELIQFDSSKSVMPALDEYIVACSPAVPLLSYTLLLDGEYYLSKSLEPFYLNPFPTQISINVNDNSLSLGAHNFTLILSSSYSGEYANDTVMVTIMLPTIVVPLSVGLSLPFVIYICFSRKRIPHLRGHRKKSPV